MVEERILITGGSGFIGTNLVESLLAKGIKLLNLDIKPPLNPAHKPYWRERDIMDAGALLGNFKEFSPTHVVHLAARTDIYETQSISGYAVNISGTENVLRAAQGTPGIGRVIITSSMLVCRLGYTPSSDTDYSAPNLYGESKVLTETITRGYGLNTVWTIIRPTTIWGPWSTRYRDEFFAVLRKGRYFHPGNAAILKSYGYVGNVVHQIEAILRAPADKVQGKTLYVGDPPLDLREWVDRFSLRIRGVKAKQAPLYFLKLLALVGDVLGALGVRFPLTTFRLRNMTMANALDMGSTLAVTGPNPFLLEQGVDETVKWLNAHPGGVK